MKVRYKESFDRFSKGTGELIEGYSGDFNIHSLSEVLVRGDWGADTSYQKDLDVFLESKQEWKDMRQAFADRDIIIDNHNTCFFEPTTKEDRERGYTL